MNKSTCQPCTTHTDCAKGGWCQSFDGRGGRCLQPCESGSELCPKDFNCKELQPGLSECFPKSNICVALCKTDADCKGGLSCQAGVCKRKGGAIEGEPCGNAVQCKSGLQCVEHPQGSRCYKVCGVLPGNAGAPCKTGNVCNAGLKCMANPLGGAVCIEPCTNGTPCANGGTCMAGLNICTCSSNNDCKNGASCNSIIKGFLSACGSGQSIKCPANEVCSGSGSIKVCLRKDVGTREIGQACDGLNRCKKGLACPAGINLCLEDCTQSKTCNLGGRCRQVRGGQSYCLCGQDSDCKDGKKCTILGQGAGYCGNAAHTGCIVGECPESFTCQNQKCIPGKKPSKEVVTTEPAKEMVSKEKVLQETATEKISKEKPTQREKISPDAGVSGDAKPELEPKTDSCGCQSTDPTPQLPTFFLFAIFFIFPLLRRGS